MPSLTQDGRPLRIDTPLPPDELMLSAVEGHEAMSQPFLFTASLLSEKPDVAGASLLRKPVHLTLVTGDGAGKRYIHGLVRRFSQLGRSEGLTSYKAEIVPAFWFATLSSDCRIFQQKTVPEILEQVLGEVSAGPFTLKTTKSYPKRDYCVQYRESHFAFLSRLMEDEGLFYFFEHTADAHTMVIGDSPSAIKACPAQAKVRIAPDAQKALGEDVVLTWEKAQEMRTGKVALTDYDPINPSLDLLASAAGAGGPEWFDYPGKYVTVDDGQRYASIALEEAEAGIVSIAGTSTARAFTSGHKFTLAEHYRRDSNGDYLLTSVQHAATAGDYRSWSGGPLDYTNRFTAMPAKTVYRPEPRTPRPRVHGTQPAVVTGPAGEEIYVDKFGRVKVHFFWDRHGARDEKSSCWVRFTTSWAGKTWGAIRIPRIGQEVMVACLEGDPDQPIIVGSVYNAEQMPPYALPANMTQSGVKSRSSKGGGGANFNEIRFEDKKGQELVYIHAEKNRQMVVENDNAESVGHDETISVGHDRTRDVGNDEAVTIGHDRTKSVANDETISVGNDRTESVGHDESVSVGNDRAHTVGRDQSYTVGRDRTRSVGRDEKVTIGRHRETNIGKNETRNVGDNEVVAIGKNASWTVGKKYVLDVGDEIVIKSGKASITLKKDGTIEIKGKDVKIDASGKINAKASSDIVLKGSKVTQN